MTGPGSARRGRITVSAGVNGAGKSSVLGAQIREQGGAYYNPDEEAQALFEEFPERGREWANARAWELGRRGLERAIARREHFAFETTLGGQSIAALLSRALDEGLEVIVHYVGLDSPERHIARVRARVARGGHDIPEAKIRQRFDTSRQHLIALLPRLTRLRVYDNSVERVPARLETPQMAPLVAMTNGRVTQMAAHDRIPVWAQPILSAAIESDRAHAGRTDPAGGPRGQGDMGRRR